MLLIMVLYYVYGDHNVIITFQGNLMVTFNGNRASKANGGVLCIGDYSTITFQENCAVTFTDNGPNNGGTIH